MPPLGAPGAHPCPLSPAPAPEKGARPALGLPKAGDSLPCWLCLRHSLPPRGPALLEALAPWAPRTHLHAHMRVQTHVAQADPLPTQPRPSSHRPRGQAPSALPRGPARRPADMHTCDGVTGPEPRTDPRGRPGWGRGPPDGPPDGWPDRQTHRGGPGTPGSRRRRRPRGRGRLQGQASCRW